MRKTVWKSQNLSKNRFSQGKHHLVPAVGTVKVELQLLQLDLQLQLQQLVTLDKPCAPVTPSDNAKLD